MQVIQYSQKRHTVITFGLRCFLPGSSKLEFDLSVNKEPRVMVAFNDVSLNNKLWLQLFFFYSPNHFFSCKKNKRTIIGTIIFNIVLSQLSLQLQRSSPWDDVTRAVLVCGVWTPVIVVIVSASVFDSSALLWEKSCCTLHSLKFKIKLQERKKPNIHTRFHSQVGPQLQKHSPRPLTLTSFI